jgi:hypothetical protein
MAQFLPANDHILALQKRWEIGKLQKTKLTSYVSKFPVLEYEEMFSLGNFLEKAHSPLTEIADDVCVGFEEADGVANLFCDCQQLRRCGDIGRKTEI